MVPWQNGAGQPIVDSSGAIIECVVCPCVENPTCAELADTGYKSTLEISIEINGVAIGSTVGCTCVNVPLSGVAPYDAGIDNDGIFLWGLAASLGCSTHTAYLAAFLNCSTFTSLVTLRVLLSVETPPFSSEIPGESWFIEWRDQMSHVDFSLGTPFILPYDDSQILVNRCQPTGHTTSTATVTVSVA